MLFGFLAVTTTYLKATEKSVMNITKDISINVSSDRIFVIVNKNALSNLKWLSKLS